MFEKYDLLKERKLSKIVFKWILHSFFIIGYFTSLVVLSVEASTPGHESGAKSDAVGGQIEDIINDLNGDTAIEYLPESAEFTNKKKEYHVGESCTLNIKTLPDEATYKSYMYSSNNVNVASVSDLGEVSFLSAGQATITATNTKEPTVQCSITFTVTNIEVTNIVSTIEDDTPEHGVYMLEVGKSYVVHNSIYPDNATIRDVTYNYNEEYISMKEDTINVLKASDSSFKFIVTSGSKSCELDIKTYVKEIDNPLVGLVARDVSKYHDQTTWFTPSISYNPSDVSEQYKGYILKSDNTSIVEADNTKLKSAGVVGTANITVTSTYDSNIKTTFKYKTITRPQLTGGTISSFNEKMYVGYTQTIGTTTSPSSGLNLSKHYLSSDTNVLTVSSSGVVTAVSLGEATVECTFEDKVYGVSFNDSVLIKVVEPGEDVVRDFSVYKKEGSANFLYAEEANDLSEIFGINNFVGNTNPENNNYKFSINTSTYKGTLSNNKIFTPKCVGEVIMSVLYTNEDGIILSKQTSINVISRYSLLDKATSDIQSEYSLYINESKEFVINTPQTAYNQIYKVVSDDLDLISINTDQLEKISVKALRSGTTSLRVIPVILNDNGDTLEVNEASITINFNILEIFTQKLDITFKDANNNLVSFDEYGITGKPYFASITLIKGKDIKLNVSISENTTKSNINVSKDNNLITIRNNESIHANNIGDTLLTITDKDCSNISKVILIKVRNNVEVYSQSLFTIRGIYSYDNETNTLKVTNGDSVSIKLNYLDSSTFKQSTYSIKDETVASIGQDGTLTPHKQGETDIVITVQDEIMVHGSYTIHLQILRKNFIQNVQQFMNLIRKALGHFGAFLVLAIFSTGAYIMFFDLKDIGYPLVMSLSVGHGFAAYTELLQLKTPGRSGLFSDIKLDFYGFITGTIIALFVVGIITLIRLIKSLLKKAKNK